MAKKKYKKRKITREQAMSARPIRSKILNRMPLDDGGERITISYPTSGIKKWLLRLPDEVPHDFDLDAFGVEVFNLCDGKNSVHGIVKKFTKNRNLDPTEIEQSVIAFLRTLIRKGVIYMIVRK